MLKNLLSSWVTGKNHIALHSIMNTINAEPEGWSELALVVLMAPKRDVSVQVGLKFPRFMHHLVAANKAVLNHGRCARYVICQQQCAQHLR